MNPSILHTRDTAHWRALVAAAEASVQSCLDDDLENYVVMLLLRFAAAGNETREPENTDELAGNLVEVGDRCLIISGLMPDQAITQGLPVRHFVETGRRAYQEAAHRSQNAIFHRLATRFVAIMDVLQVMRTLDEDVIAVDLFRVYDQWTETGSQYAYRLIRAATDALPVRQLSQRHH